MDVVKRREATRNEGEKRNEIAEDRAFFRTVKRFCMILQWWTHVIYIYQNPHIVQYQE